MKSIEMFDFLFQTFLYQLSSNCLKNRFLFENEKLQSNILKGTTMQQN